MSEVKPRSRPRRSDVRQCILDAAMSVFAAHGFAGATIDAIAAAAGFTKGAVYSNFASKDDLFFALMDQEIFRRAEMVVESFANVRGGPPARAAAVGEQLMQASRTNPEWQILFFEFWLRAMRDQDVRARFVEHRRAVRALITRAADALSSTVGLTGALSPEAVTFLLLGLSNGLAIEEMIDPGVVPDSLIGDVLTRLQHQ